MKSLTKKVVKRRKKRIAFYSVLGGLLRMRRQTLGLTQRQVARKLRHSDPSMYNGLETGRLPARTAQLPSLARILDVNLHQVVAAAELDLERRRMAAEIRAFNKRFGI